MEGIQGMERRLARQIYFEDNFDSYDPGKWQTIGDHPSFNIQASDGWLHVLFDEYLPGTERKRHWVAVSSKQPFDLSNKAVMVRLTAVPSLLTPEVPIDDYHVGVLLANKKEIINHPLLNPDPDLKGVCYFMRWYFQTPIQKVGVVIDKGVATWYYGGVFARFPPTELAVAVGLTKVITYEEKIEDLVLPLPADPTSLYVHLYIQEREIGTLLLPSRASFDYITIAQPEFTVEYPKPEQVMMSALPQLLNIIMSIMMVTVMLRLIRGIA